MTIIGFKTQAQQKQEQKPAKIEEIDNFTASQMLGKSMAHVDLMNQINEMSNVVVSDDFSQKPIEQKTHFLQMLINNIALNTELNVKNKMLRENKISTLAE